ncbi:hypothetical protein HU200_022581 [Digitaria exilis]|uniref:Aminotransferase-like plant mobile domain-containing protein n=1 Tax=Digitaria exilis TaxID=1010633 RepID=A0A835CDN3_9POAL|nr:hypothetical protein HU200_022581 [Digitaria exilis]
MPDGQEVLVQESNVPAISPADPSRRSVRLAYTLLPGVEHGFRLPALPSPPRDPGPALARGAALAEFRGWASCSKLWRRWVDKLRPRHEVQWQELGILDAILTTTYKDVAALAGLPLVGTPVRAPVSYELEKDVGALEAVRVVLNQSKNRKPSYGLWVKHFLERAPAPDKEESAAGGRGDEVEHRAFLSMWLSRFVLPSPPLDVVQPGTFPIAVRLARGQSVALAPAALASIYSDLSALKCHLNLREKKEPPFGNVRNVLDSRYVYTVLMSPKEFEWRPYGSSSVALQPKTSGCWVRGQDIATSKTLLSFARCLRPCELVGMKCIEKYHPHRVARQLGFDQDVPGNVIRVNSSWEKAWDSYNIEAKDLAFVVPNHKPGVTVKYAQWWEPYSFACARAVADAVNAKQLCVLVNPVKRKLEGRLAAISSKKMHVDTSIRIYQPAPDAAQDLVDEIPLVKRLNNIIKLTRKKHTAECLVKGSDQEINPESSNSLKPISASVGAKKAMLHKDFEQTLADDFTNSSMVHGSSCSLVTKMALEKYPHQTASPEDILVIGDCEVESGLKHRTARQESDVLAARTLQICVDHSKGPTEVMQKYIIAGDKVHKEKIGPLHCNESNDKGNEGVSNQELESVIENLAEANRKKSGINGTVRCARHAGWLMESPNWLAWKFVQKLSITLVDLIGQKMPGKKRKIAGVQIKDVYMPRRAVGTMEMIEKASLIRKVEIAELKKNIDRLMEEILALEADES